MRNFKNLRTNLMYYCSKHGYQPVIDATGLHYNTVYEIVTGKQTNPRLHTLEALDRFFDEIYGVRKNEQ